MLPFTLIFASIQYSPFSKISNDTFLSDVVVIVFVFPFLLFMTIIFAKLHLSGCSISKNNFLFSWLTEIELRDIAEKQIILIHSIIVMVGIIGLLVKK